MIGKISSIACVSGLTKKKWRILRAALMRAAVMLVGTVVAAPTSASANVISFPDEVMEVLAFLIVFPLLWLRRKRLIKAAELARRCRKLVA
jgi:hypothetical protein